MKKYKLPKDFAEKWVAALRSGDYKQGAEQLVVDGGYCCLGVACKIVGATDIELGSKQWIHVNPSIGHCFETEPYFFKYIPLELHGMNRQSPLVDNVSDMNDGGKSFDEIADWIEENVEFINTQATDPV